MGAPPVRAAVSVPWPDPAVTAPRRGRGQHDFDDDPGGPAKTDLASRAPSARSEPLRPSGATRPA